MAAVVRRGVQESLGDVELPDDIDERISRVYPTAFARLPAQLRADYLRTGWSARLVYEWRRGLRVDLGLPSTAARPSFRPPQRGGPDDVSVGGRLPDPDRFAEVVTDVRDLLSDRFTELPAGVNEWIAIAFEALPGGLRDLSGQDVGRRAARAMYEGVRTQLEELNVAQRGAGWQMRRRLREATSRNPARDVVDPTQFGLPARQDLVLHSGDERSSGSASMPARSPADLAPGDPVPGLVMSAQASSRSDARVLSEVNRYMLGLIADAAAAAPIELRVTAGEGRAAARRVLDVVIPHLFSELRRRHIDRDRLTVRVRLPSRGFAAAHHEVTLAATVAPEHRRLSRREEDLVAEVSRRLQHHNLPTAPARIVAISRALRPRLNSSASMVDAVTAWIRDGDIPRQYRRGLYRYW
jgi:hypothetical protein